MEVLRRPGHPSTRKEGKTNRPTFLAAAPRSDWIFEQLPANRRAEEFMMRSCRQGSRIVHA